jgi:hypothetical protein
MNFNVEVTGISIRVVSENVYGRELPLIESEDVYGRELPLIEPLAQILRIIVPAECASVAAERVRAALERLLQSEIDGEISRDCEPSSY